MSRPDPAETAARYRIESQDVDRGQGVQDSDPLPYVGNLLHSPTVQWQGLTLPRWLVERNQEFFRRTHLVSMVLPQAENCINCTIVDNCNWHASESD